MERLLAERATVFLIGSEEADTTPLMLALTGYIARSARRIAADAAHPLSRGGRLDPTLTLALDECALIAPIPLPSWSADMGGRGITIIAAFQSHAQIVSRYGPHDAAVIMDNCGGSLLFGGTADEADLRWWAARAGDRDEVTTTTDAAGKTLSRSVRRVPVFSAAQIANLRPGQVIVFRAGVSASIGWTRMAWRRRDVRAVARGWPAATAAAGVLGAVAYTAHRPSVRALLALDRRLGAAAAAITVRPVAALLRPAASTAQVRVRVSVLAVLDPARWTRAAAQVVAGLRVLGERTRFLTRRLRPARRPRSTSSTDGPDGDAAEFFRVAAAPGPLRGHLIDPTTDGTGARALRPLRVVSRRAPAPALEHSDEQHDEQHDQHLQAEPTGGPGEQEDPPTGPIDLSDPNRDTGEGSGQGSEDDSRDGGGRWTA